MIFCRHASLPQALHKVPIHTQSGKEGRADHDQSCPVIDCQGEIRDDYLAQPLLGSQIPAISQSLLKFFTQTYVQCTCPIAHETSQEQWEKADFDQGKKSFMSTVGHAQLYLPPPRDSSIPITRTHLKLTTVLCIGTQKGRCRRLKHQSFYQQFFASLQPCTALVR